jgi:hypothetical protein
LLLSFVEIRKDEVMDTVKKEIIKIIEEMPEDEVLMM